MTDTTTTTTTPPAGAGAPNGAPPPATSATPPAAPDLAKLQAELAAAQAMAAKHAAELADAQAQIHKGNDENAKRRLAEKEARDKAEQEARAKGESDKVIKSLEDKLAESAGTIEKLRALEDAAARWKAFEAEELKAIEAKLPSMPAHWKDFVGKAPTLELKRAALAAFDAEAASKQPPPKDEKKPGPPAPPGGAPPGTPPPQITDARFATIDELKNLKASNPDAYYAAIGGKDAEKPKPTGLFSRLIGR